MNYKSFLCGLGLGIALSICVSVAQEFVLDKKDKKVTVSHQQCAEVLGDYIHLFSDIMKVCSEIIGLSAHVHGAVLEHIDNYVDGCKESVAQRNKGQRALFYQKMNGVYTQAQEMLDGLKVMAKTLEKQRSTVDSL